MIEFEKKIAKQTLNILMKKSWNTFSLEQVLKNVKVKKTYIKTQHAQSPIQSFFELPAKLAYKINQSNIGGIDFIIMKIVKSVNKALKLLEFIFLFKISKERTPLNSILIR